MRKLTSLLGLAVLLAGCNLTSSVDDTDMAEGVPETQIDDMMVPEPEMLPETNEIPADNQIMMDELAPDGVIDLGELTTPPPPPVEPETMPVEAAPVE